MYRLIRLPGKFLLQTWIGLALSLACLSNRAPQDVNSPVQAIEAYRQQNSKELLLLRLFRILNETSEPDARKQTGELIVREYCRQLLDGHPFSGESTWSIERLQSIPATSVDIRSPQWRLVVDAARMKGLLEQYREWVCTNGEQTDLRAIAAELRLLTSSIEITMAEIDSLMISGTLDDSLSVETARYRYRALSLAVAAGTLLAETGFIQPDDVRLTIQRMSELTRRNGLDVDTLNSLTPADDYELAAISNLAVVAARSGDDGLFEAALKSIHRFPEIQPGQLAIASTLSRCGQPEVLKKWLIELQNDEVPEHADLYRTILVLAAAQSQQAEAVNEARLLAACGLARISEEQLVISLEESRRPVDLSNAEPFYRDWLSGAINYGNFLHGKRRADEHSASRLPGWISTGSNSLEVPDRELLKQAVSGFFRALEISEDIAGNDRLACTVSLASASFEDGDNQTTLEYAMKAIQFQEKKSVSLRREQAALLAVSAIERIVAADPASFDQLADSLSFISESFTNSRAGMQATRQFRFAMLRNAQPDIAVREISRQLIDYPTDPGLRFELLSHQFRLWQSDESIQGKKLLESMIDNASQIDQSPVTSDAMRIRAWTLVAQAIRNDPEGDEAIRERLKTVPQRLEQLALENADNAKITGEARMSAIRMAICSNADGELVERSQKWLIENPQAGEWHRLAVLDRARSLEEQYPSGVVPQQELDLAIQVFELLLGLEGRNKSALVNNPNSRIAASRLAALYFQRGAKQLSYELYREVLDAHPNDRSALTAVARMSDGFEKPEMVAEYWRRLSRLSETGTNLWRESRWQLAIQTGKSDPTKAGQIATQTVELDPEMPQEWKSRFSSLIDR